MEGEGSSFLRDGLERESHTQTDGKNGETVGLKNFLKTKKRFAPGNWTKCAITHWMCLSFCLSLSAICHPLFEHYSHSVGQIFFFRSDHFCASPPPPLLFFLSFSIQRMSMDAHMHERERERKKER
jgi:hypothetical protein